MIIYRLHKAAALLWWLLFPILSIAWCNRFLLLNVMEIVSVHSFDLHFVITNMQENTCTHYRNDIMSLCQWHITFPAYSAVSTAYLTRGTRRSTVSQTFPSHLVRASLRGVSETSATSWACSADMCCISPKDARSTSLQSWIWCFGNFSSASSLQSCMDLTTRSWRRGLIQLFRGLFCIFSFVVSNFSGSGILAATWCGDSASFGWSLHAAEDMEVIFCKKDLRMIFPPQSNLVY